MPGPGDKLPGGNVGDRTEANAWVRVGLVAGWLAALKQGDAMRVEIRAAEGGDDAKLLIHEMFRIYQKAGARRCF